MFYKKYLKYKIKYLNFKNQTGGEITEETQLNIISDSISNANEILRYSNETWNIGKPFLFISLGASPAYTFTVLDTLLKKIASPHSIIEIPLSTLSCLYSNEKWTPKPDKIQKFAEYILPLIGHYKDSHTFIIIDHCHTCESINGFITLLETINISTPCNYINLIDTKTPISYIHRPIKIHNYKMIINKTINDIAGHKIPRAVPKYSFFDDLGKSIDFTTISQDAIMLRLRIKKTVEES